VGEVGRAGKAAFAGAGSEVTLEAKDLKILKGDYTHRINAVKDRVTRLERRVEWVEKLLWLAVGAVISWLVTIVIRSM